MNITYSNSITVEDFNLLRKSVGWFEIREDNAKTGLENSVYIISAKNGNKTVGMARIISDGGYIAFIADVIVLPEYQGNGIGKTMMTFIMNYLRESINNGSFDYILVSLVASKGKEKFYEKFGLITRPTDGLGAGMSVQLTKEDKQT